MSPTSFHCSTPRSQHSAGRRPLAARPQDRDGRGSGRPGSPAIGGAHRAHHGPPQGVGDGVPPGAGVAEGESGTRVGTGLPVATGVGDGVGVGAGVGLKVGATAFSAGGRGDRLATGVDDVDLLAREVVPELARLVLDPG